MMIIKILLVIYIASIYLSVKVTDYEIANDPEIQKLLKPEDKGSFYRISCLIPILNTALWIDWLGRWVSAGFSAKKMKDL